MLGTEILEKLKNYLKLDFKICENKITPRFSKYMQIKLNF